MIVYNGAVKRREGCQLMWLRFGDFIQSMIMPCSTQRQCLPSDRDRNRLDVHAFGIEAYLLAL
jgi:hypothetical protein